MNIFRRDWLSKSFEMVALKHLFFVKTRLIAMPLGVDRVQVSKEVRNRSSARRCFECLILPFF